MRWTIPNILTAGRILAAPAVALAFVTLPRPVADWIAFLLFAAASFTDYLDGWLARRLNMVSEVGKMLDPIADKAMVIISLAVLVARQPNPVRIDDITYFLWDPIATLILIPGAVIILREVMVSGLREYLGDVKLPVTQLAKWKTAVQMVAIGVLLLAPLLVYFQPGPQTLEEYVEMAHHWTPVRVVTNIGLVLLWLAAVLTAITGWDYFRKGLTYIRTREED